MRTRAKLATPLPWMDLTTANRLKSIWCFVTGRMSMCRKTVLIARLAVVRKGHLATGSLKVRFLIVRNQAASRTVQAPAVRIRLRAQAATVRQAILRLVQTWRSIVTTCQSATLACPERNWFALSSTRSKFRAFSRFRPMTRKLTSGLPTSTTFQFRSNSRTPAVATRSTTATGSLRYLKSRIRRSRLLKIGEAGLLRSGNSIV